MQEPTFSEDFMFGAATAAFQIEGGAEADGKGLSVWDVFCRHTDTVFNGADGSGACNSYELWKQDVELLKGLGADAYRFSISWPRVLPEGTGRVNRKGMDYYKRLAATLRDNGIEPCVTLYHWDLPYELSLKGGLMNRDFAAWFTDYAALVEKELGSDVNLYFTFNEPLSVVGAGYGLGTFAPGCKFGNGGSFPALHNLLLAHGDSARYLHAQGKRTAIVNCGDAPYPADENDSALIEKAREKTFACDYVWNCVNVFDPVFLGDYPKEFYERFAWEAEHTVRDGDMKRICGNTDYCCMNHYSGFPVGWNERGEAEEVRRPQGYPMMQTGWAMDTNGLFWLLKFLQERYRKPIMITENGMACHDVPSADGGVHDEPRVEYFRRILHELHRAENAGIDLRGYFVWSLLDNFEWLSGYSQRFGITYVDYKTFARTPKSSYYYLRDMFAQRK